MDGGMEDALLQVEWSWSSALSVGSISGELQAAFPRDGTV